MKNSTLSYSIINAEKSGLRILFLGAIISFFILFLTPADVFCQLPQGFNYQAIAREDGNPVITPIGVMLTIQSAADGGTTFWIELHSAVQPNTSGLFTIVVGAGVKQAGSTANTFSEIDWSVGPKFLKTEINTGSGFVTMGTSQFLSVPYSVVADGLGGALDKLTVAAPVTSTSLTEPLFEVKNNTGQTVFAVYNEGVRIYVDNGAKGVKGGFAIGGFGTDKAASQPLFVVNSDSIRAYIDPTAPVKGAKGGFAIGGFGMAKGVDEYLRVTRDSTRIYINDLPTGKGIKGGFAIGGFGMAKGNMEYLRITDDSTRIYINDDLAKGIKGGFAIGGFSTGKAITPKFLSVNIDKTTVQVSDSSTGFSVSNIQTGISENFMKMNAINYRLGHQSGEKINQAIGKYNTFFGYKTGYNTTDGRENLFVGYQAGYSNAAASYNVYMGTESGKANISGTSNVFIGFGSGKASTTSNNVYIGMKAGNVNAAGAGNTYIGYASGVDEGRPGYVGGSFNTFLGFNSGAKNYTGSNNVYLGAEASGNSRGTGRILIGYKAGYSVLADNILIIDNYYTSGANPLIYGDFVTGIVTFNRVLKLTPGAAPAVPAEGQIYANSTDHHLYYYNGTTWKQLDN